MSLKDDILAISGAFTTAYDTYENPDRNLSDFVSSVSGVVAAVGNVFTNEPAIADFLQAAGKIGVIASWDSDLDAWEKAHEPADSISAALGLISDAAATVAAGAGATGQPELAFPATLVSFAASAAKLYVDVHKNQINTIFTSNGQPIGESVAKTTSAGHDLFMVTTNEEIDYVSVNDQIYLNNIAVNGISQYGDHVDDNGFYYNFASDYSSVTVSDGSTTVVVKAAPGQYGSDGQGGGHVGPIQDPPANKKKRPPWEPVGGDTPQRSPLIFDLTGNGVTTTSVDNGVQFDIGNTGYKQETAWAGAGSGFLVYDPSGGAITNGSQMFGTATKLANGSQAVSGFQALSQYDIYNIQRIDSNNPVWSSLRIWQDTNGNGVTDPGEILTMSQAGIAAISLFTTGSSLIDANGNSHGLIGSYTTTSGQTREVDDVWLSSSGLNSQPTTTVPVPANIAALPNLRGFGTVADLQQTMAKDASGSLAALVAQFATTTDDSQRNTLVDQILLAWTGATGINPTSQGPYVNAQHMAAVTAVAGAPFMGVYCNGVFNPGGQPNWLAGPDIERGYAYLHDWAYGALMAQTWLAPLYQAITTAVDPLSGVASTDLSAVQAIIVNGLGSNRAATLAQLSQFNLSAQSAGLASGTGWNSFRKSLAAMGGDVAATFPYDQMTVNGAGATAVIDGWLGNQTLIGDNAGDTFLGSGGNDTISGGLGSDVFEFDKGNGSVIIASDSGGTNVLRMGQGIAAANIYLTKSGNDLLVSDGTPNDQVRIVGFYTNPTVQSIAFADGSSMPLTNGLAVHGTSANDSLAAGNANNTYIGGPGNDSFQGGTGNDTYIFNLSDGQDTITDIGGTDTLQLGPGITAANLTFTSLNNDLIVSVDSTGDQIRISNQFSGSDAIEKITFADGSSMAMPLGQTVTGTAGSDTLFGTAGNDTITGLAGNDSLFGNGGNDTFIGGPGNDVIYGNTGNDTFIFNRGDGSDTIYGQGGSDVIQLGAGITAANVSLTTSGYDLLIGLGSGDQIRVNGYFSNTQRPTLFFSDGTTFALPVGATVTGTAGNDVLSAAAAVNTYYGLAGNDTIYCGSDGDTVVGGPGNDTIYGGGGSATYIFNQGDGSDTITSGGGVIQFGLGINASNVSLSVSDNADLTISYGSAGDQIFVSSQYNTNGNPTDPPIGTIKFDDGSTLSLLGIKVTGASNATVNGTWSNDTLIAGSGTVTINGKGGNDTFFGGSGTQVMNAGNGNNIFIVGTGAETINAGYGNDIYSYAKGDGQVTINDAYGNDTLKFAAGIASSDISYTISANDLVIGDGVQGDQITIKGQFSWSSNNVPANATGYLNQIENVVFADGATKYLAAGLNVVASGNGVFNGSGRGDTLFGGSGTETLIGNGGNDSFVAGTGAETMISSNGNNTYVYTQGSGAVTINNNINDWGPPGTDTLILSGSLTLTNTVFVQSGNDLVITDGLTGDTVTLRNQYYNGNGYYQVEKLIFGDGSTMSLTGGLPIKASGNGTFNGTGGADTLIGGAGTEVLNGNGGNDTFIAGTGTETWNSYNGNNTYVYTQGSGAVTINNNINAWGPPGTDTLILSGSLTLTNTFFTRSGNDLVITDGLTGDTITLRNQYNGNSNYQVETLLFSNGTTMSLTGGLPVLATGNGTFSGTTASEALLGGAGTEVLNGNGGNDIFVAGSGTETLFGGSGNDTYSYAAGDGLVTIADSGGTNSLFLGAGLSSANVSWSTSGSDLLITDGISGDQIDIVNQIGPASRFTSLTFLDGSSLNLTGLSLAASSGTTLLNGTTGSDTLIGAVGNETLTGNGGNDTFIAGTGTETLIGGTGNDSYSYAAGDGFVAINDPAGTNGLFLSAGINSQNTIVSESGSDLVIADGNVGDQIVLRGQASTISPFNKLTFADGTTLSLAGVSLTMPSGASLLNGTSGNDTLSATSGNQTLIGNGGGDTFIGSSGTETLNAAAGNGNNVFIFGQGSATALGGSGNDLYSYQAGDGSVTLNDTGGNNTFVLGGTLGWSDLAFQLSGNDLLITDGTAGDQVKIINHGVQAIAFANGSTASLLIGASLTAGSGNSTLTGTQWNDTLIGNSGVETLLGNGGNDTFIAGIGTETLSGGVGNDFYSYAQGDGVTVITDSGGNDKLVLGTGLTAANVTVSQSGNDLLITDGQAGDQITLRNQFTSGNPVEWMLFADGSSQSLTGLKVVASGNGAFGGGATSDTLIGGTGNETLTGNGGNDTFIAGTGTETMVASYGNDKFSYAQGSGNVTINDAYGNDTLYLGTGLTAANVVFAVSGNNLLITDGTAGDQITILNQYLWSSGYVPNYSQGFLNQIETVVFGDGSTMSLAGGVPIKASGNGSFNGSGWNDTLIGGTGNETLTGNGGNDTFIAGTGTETMVASYGNDKFSYAQGSGNVTINDAYGNDTLYLGTGLTAANVVFAVSGNNLLITDGTAGDQITILNQYLWSSGYVPNYSQGFLNQIETVVFGDGSTMSLAGGVPIKASGNGSFNGSGWNDTLIGGTGNETLTGNGGNDTFIAGTGTETMVASYGNDKFSYAQGSGNVTINDAYGNDTLYLGTGLTAANVVFAVSGNNLLITDGTAGDQITILNQYLWSSGYVPNYTQGMLNQIETVVFGDGSSMGLTGGVPIKASGNGAFGGSGWNDTLIGGTGNETLTGNGGNDTFIAGTGTETMVASYGNDKFSYAQGSGNVTINDAYGNDTLYLGTGLTAANVVFAVSGNNLLITDGTAGDQITILNQYLWSSGYVPNYTQGMLNQIETVVFGDGSTMGLNGGVPIKASGNGAFGGSGWNDTLIGGAGNETLTGNGGNDTFIAGTGTETMVASYGNDKFSYAQGSGNVTINDAYGNDTLYLGTGLTAANVVFAVSGNNLLITDGSAGDQIAILNQYLWSSGYVPNYALGMLNQIETVVFGDGSSIAISSGLPLHANGNGSLVGTSGNDTLIGGNGNETLIGNGGNDTFLGGTGIQIMNASNGNNVFISGSGGETFNGGSGNDTYSYARGAGNVVINDVYGSDTLYLGTGLTAANVVFAVSGNNLLITDGTAGDQITIQNQYLWNYGYYPSYVSGNLGQIEKLVFADGSSIDLTAGLPLQLNGSGVFGGTQGNDTFVYNRGSGNVSINDKGGTDILSFGGGLTTANLTFTMTGNDLLIFDGTAGDQIDLVNQFGSNASPIEAASFANGQTISLLRDLALTGTSGNDSMVGTGGNETFTGGIGNDTLVGGAGNTTYIFNSGDGQDVINDAGGNDTILFGAGISSADIRLSVSGADLLVTYTGSGDQIRIVNELFFNGIQPNAVETLRFADGSTMSLLGGLPLTASATGGVVSGTSGDDTLMGDAGNNSILGNGGNDTFIGAGGNDTLIGGYGNDTYVFGLGNGGDVINDPGGRDTLLMGAGISASNIHLLGDGSDMVILVGSGGDQIRILNQLNLNGGALISNAVETMAFTDGSTLSLTSGPANLQASGTGAAVNGTPWGDTLSGPAGSDTLIGNGGNDIFIAGSGNTLEGYTGNDTYSFSQGSGSNTIIDAGGSDTLKLGAGLTSANVTFQVTTAGDLLVGDGVPGDQIVLLGQFVNSGQIETLVFGDGTTRSLVGGMLLSGTTGNDTILGSPGNDTIIGNGGNDTFQGAIGNDTLQGGSGNDTYIHNLGDGTDTIIDSGGTNTLKLGAGLNQSNVYLTVNGNDLIVEDPYTSDQIVIHNQYNGNVVQNLVFGDGSTMNIAGALTIHCLGDGTFVGTPYADTIIGGAGSESLWGGVGNDTLVAGTGNQQLVGGAGDDVLIGGSGIQALDGGSGNNTFTGGNGTETFYGNTSSGNELFVAGVGYTSIYGGTGANTYSYAAGDGSLFILPSGGTNTLKLSSGMTLGKVMVSEGPANDLLISDGIAGDQIDAANQWGSGATGLQALVFGDGTSLNLTTAKYGSGTGTVTGTTGADILFGGTGNETLTGNGGNDKFFAGTGTETLNGGSGNDTYCYVAGDGNVTINDSGGTDTLILGSGLIQSNITFSISSYDLQITDNIVGDKITVKNQFKSGNSIDTLVFSDGSTMALGVTKPVLGTTSTTTLNGTTGSDTLIGQSGNETITGKGGNDTFIGGSGRDTLTGNTGNDSYIAYRGNGSDTIIDTGGTDTLTFGIGIADDQVWFAQQGNNLVLTVIGTTQSVQVNNWYSGSANQIETIKTQDGHSLLNTQVANLVNAMAGLTPPPLGQTTLTTALANQLESVIAANWH